jgi:hypothetical protein
LPYDIHSTGPCCIDHVCFEHLLRANAGRH